MPPGLAPRLRGATSARHSARGGDAARTLSAAVLASWPPSPRAPAGPAAPRGPWTSQSPREEGCPTTQVSSARRPWVGELVQGDSDDEGSEESQSTEDTDSPRSDGPGWQAGPLWRAASSPRLLGAAAGELGTGLGAAMRSPRMDFSEPPFASDDWKGDKEAVTVPPLEGDGEVTFHTVVFDRSRGDKLGIEVNHADGVTLFIEEVTSGGLCEAWNLQHPDQVVRRRDRIVATNGVSGNALCMMDELMQNRLHSVTISRKLRAAQTPRGPAWASTSISMQTPRQRWPKVQLAEGLPILGPALGAAAHAPKLGADEEAASAPEDDLVSTSSRSTSSARSSGHDPDAESAARRGSTSSMARLSIPLRGQDALQTAAAQPAPRGAGAGPSALSPRGTPRAGVSGSLQRPSATPRAGAGGPLQRLAAATSAAWPRPRTGRREQQADPEGAPGERLRDGLAPLNPFSGAPARQPLEDHLPEHLRRLPAVVGLQRSWAVPAIRFPELDLVDPPMPSG